MHAASPLTFAIMLFATGCAPVVYFVPSQATAVARPPRQPGQVRLYLQSIPACPYDEIGQIELGGSYSPNEGLEIVRQEAARRGADAAIIEEHRDSSRRTYHSYSATAIALPQGPCAQSVHHQPSTVAEGARHH